MASRAVIYWRRMVVKENRMNGVVVTRSFVSSTTPKMASATNATSGRGGGRGGGGVKKPQMVELYPLFGMLAVALAVAVHTAYQNIVHSPGIKLAKKKRESLPEVDNPDATVHSSGNLINKSFLRKIGQIQHDENPVMPNTSRPNPFTVSREVESLKSVGVGPRTN